MTNKKQEIEKENLVRFNPLQHAKLNYVIMETLVQEKENLESLNSFIIEKYNLNPAEILDEFEESKTLEKEKVEVVE